MGFGIDMKIKQIWEDMKLVKADVDAINTNIALLAGCIQEDGYIEIVTRTT